MLRKEQTCRQITGSVANVTEDNFNKGLTRDATDLLQGKVAGLMINSGSGDVTSVVRIASDSLFEQIVRYVFPNEDYKIFVDDFRRIA